jgi:hypothetical protein
MRTDDLIRTLAADNDWRSTPTGRALVVALLAATPFSILLFTMTLGFRPDIAAAAHNPFFDL